jgi:hypothetical protein
MSTVHENKTQPIVLDFRNVKQPITVCPDDQDRFVTTASDAARACHFFDQLNQWLDDFKGFLAYVHDWAEAHSADVSRVYVAPGLAGLEVFVVTRGDGYRFDLDDDVSRFDLDLVGKFRRCPAHVMQLPDDSNETLQSFFSPEGALQVYG